MARASTGLHISGTIGNVCIYEMYGKTFIRSKSSLTRKRVLKSREFEKTRRYASNMGRAAQIGSVIYRALPADIKERWLYRAITGEAASLLYSGQPEQEVKNFLWKKYIDNTKCRPKEAKPTGLLRSSTESAKLLRQVFLERWQAQRLPYHFFSDGWSKKGRFDRERFGEMMKIMRIHARAR